MNYKRLADVATFINGKAFKPEDWKTVGLPIIRIQNLTGSNNVYNYYNGLIEERYLVRRGDLLISWSASLGIYEWDNEEGVLNQHIFKVKLNNNVNKKYFYYAIQTRLLEMESHVHGSTMKHITKGRFDNIKIPLPDLQTQKQIAAILEDADRARQQRKAANALTEQFLQSSFLHLFGDPVINEKGWVKVTIKQMGVVKTGNTPSREVKDYYGDFIEWIKSDNISLASLHPAKATEYLSQQGLKVGRFVDKNSILVTCIAGSTNSIGNVVLTDRKVSFNQQINSLTPSNEYDPLFVYVLFRQCKKLIQESTTQGMKRIITKSVFENLEMIKPPLPLQQHFAALVADAEILRQKQLESERELEHLFQALLQQYFGEHTATVIAVEEPLSLAAETEVQYGKY